LGLFNFKKSPEKADAKAGEKPTATAEEAKPKRSLQKARRFFEHAQAVADARNYEYAIECYINGLRHEPDNLSAHEGLRDVALRRKVGGGKPAGLSEMFTASRDPVEKMLHAEKLWAKEPLSLARMIEAMSRMVDVYEKVPDLDNIGDVAHWIGELILDKNEHDRPPGKKELVAIRDLYSRLGSFSKAVQACQAALNMEPGDAKLAKDLDDLMAEETMEKGGYTTTKAENVDFKKSVLDQNKQQALEQEDSIAKTEQAKDEVIARTKEAFEKNREDVDLRLKVVRALLDKNTNAHDDEAVKLLTEALEKTGQYRHKVGITDIQMRQMARQMKELKTKADGGDEAAAHEFKELARKKLKFELAEFADRVKNYPTERRWRFELGTRLYMARKFDEAIAMFQQSRGDPKYRGASNAYLGRCYVHVDMLDEAVETLGDALTNHANAEDKIGMELQYLKMDAHVRTAKRDREKQPDAARNHLKEAQRMASKLLQININYQDVKARLEEVRSLGKEIG
jgi:tetratricopeptide (TPR) repeat protein